MVDIQSVAAEIRRGKKIKKKIETTGKNIMACPITYGGYNKRSWFCEGGALFLGMINNVQFVRNLLWPPCVADADIIFLSRFFLFFSPNLSGRRMDVYHTSTHDVVLVRI